MDRMTRSRLETAFAAYVRTLRGCGIESDDYYLIHGSVSNGRTWEIHTGKPSRAAGADIFGSIGRTPREAFNTLHTIIRTLQDAKEMTR